MSLTEFLLARIAEDEWAAKASAFDPNWTAYPDDVGQPIKDGRGARLATCAESVMSHIARHDPARVLAECEAKRRIVEALTDAESAVAKYDDNNPDNPPSYWQEWGNRHALRLAAELLGQPYANHPDFKAEWKP